MNNPFSPPTHRPAPRPASRGPRTAIIMDYQNIHLTAHDLFGQPDEAIHQTLIHPLHFANTVIRERNAGLRPGYLPATLSTVLCYRGQPSSRYDHEQFARTDAQRAAWTASDNRVKVIYRPLRYTTRPVGYSTETGTHYEVDSVTEKGIDVLCATAAITQSLRADIDLVILASHDTDLSPCLDAVINVGNSKIETVQWWNPKVGVVGHLRPLSGHKLWNTRLDADAYESSRDRVIY